jgi:hypothetical protein
MTSLARLLRFGAGRTGCVYEHLMCAPTSEETHELLESFEPIVPLSGDVSELFGQIGSPARDRRPIIV